MAAQLLALDTGTTDLCSALGSVLDLHLPSRRLTSRPWKVHIVSGSYGAGHDSAAAEVGRRLVAAGHEVTTWDVVDLFPAGRGRLARWLYLRQLALVPSTWGSLLRRLQPDTRAMRVARRFMGLVAPRLRRLASGADLVVSTHPFASQALGQLRETGALSVPAVTYLVDASVHPLWVHDAVDLHLALHPGAGREASSLGGTTRVIDPLVPEAYDRHQLLDLTARGRVRRDLGLSPVQRMVLVVGGSLGIGELEQTAVDVLASGLAVPVVACGTNIGLRARLSALPGVLALGWREDLPELIQAADCVVGNAGGFTAWECLAAGTPVITARSLAGHGTTNAAALDAAGLAPWVREHQQLAEVLRVALDVGDRRPVEALAGA